jgi:lipoate-protein ligase A
MSYEANWRFIDFEKRKGFRNMALDEAVFERLKDGFSRPTIRLYGWYPSCVSIGAFQRLKDEVDEDACRTEDIDILRRKTGGGAVFHDSEGEITYSVIARSKDFECEPNFENICQPVINFLEEIGLEAEFEPVNDIHSNGRKISGNARAADSDVILQHGTILYDVKPEKMFTYLKPEVSKISDKHIKSVKKRVTSITRKKDISRDECKRVLADNFRTACFIDSIEKGDFTDEERKVAGEIEKRHSSNDWKYKGD